MSRLINWALTDLMLEHREIAMMGEDIGPKGGVYGVTAKLHDRFGPGRVINTLLDEQSILGLAIGMAHNGFVADAGNPVPRLSPQCRGPDPRRGGDAVSFFSNGQYTNPMVHPHCRAWLPEGLWRAFPQRQFSLAVFRDIPGVILAVPSNGRDAVLMLRECVRLAREEQRVVVFVEPIALYSTRDLHEAKDGLDDCALSGAGRGRDPAWARSACMATARDVAIVTYGNGAFLSRQAAKLLADKHGISVRIIDLRWLNPLNEKAIIEAACRLCQAC